MYRIYTLKQDITQRYIHKIWLIMRLTTVILMATLMQVSAGVFAQRINLSKSKAPLKVVLKELRLQSGYNFVYTDDLLKKSRPVDIQVSEADFEIVLKKIFDEQPLSYTINKNTITIKEKEGSFLDRISDAFTNIDIRGRIVDEKNNALVGASITIKGTQAVTRSDDNGEFLLKNVDAKSVLQISYVGYKTKEVKASESLDNIRMESSFDPLKEIVVVGYGKQTKATLTGAVSSVSGDDLVMSPTANVTQSLAGRLPGLIAYSSSGLPGQDNATLLIRGLSTTGDNSPLIVIDGVVRSNFMSTTNTSNVNPLSYLDPNDIESISLLKDASATAVYGARAANGVILVSTKRGSEGATTISYSVNAGLQKSNYLYEPLDSYTTALYWNEAWKNENAFMPTAGGAKGYSDAALTAIQTGSDPNRYANTNWYKAVFGTSAAQTEHNVSINGGTSKIKYFVSGGFFNQDGFYKGVGFDRYSIRSNIDGNVAKNLEFSLNLAGRIEAGTTQSGNVMNAINISPLAPILYTNGTFHYDLLSVGNPYAISQGLDGYNKTTKNYFESSGSLVYHIPGVEGLSIKGLLSFDKYFIFNKVFTKPYTAYILNDDDSYTLPNTLAAAAPSLAENYNQFQSITQEASVNYGHAFGAHNVSGLLLYTQTQNNGDVLSAARVNFPSAILDQLNQGSLNGLSNGGSGSENARRGVVGRAAYNYKLKYLTEVSFRYDGSDLFPPKHRYGFFPAVSAGWRLSEEDFIKDNLKFITNLKLRASWGQAGNDRAGAFQFLNTYAISNSYGFGGTAAVPSSILVPGVIANPVFTWEKAVTTDVGLEGNLWNDLLSFDIDVFSKRTSNILLSLANKTPVVIGGLLPVENYVIVDNKGIEGELGHKSSIGNVNYFIRSTFTFNRSKVIRYPQGESVPIGQQVQGKPVSPDAIIGYEADGLYQSQAEITNGPTPLLANVQPGDIKYKDVNGDNKITASDQVVITRGRTPGVVYGLNMGLSYKGFDVSGFFQGAADAQTYLPIQFNWSFNGPNTIAYPIQVDHWTPDHTDATYPRLTVISKNNQQTSDYWVRNASYLRLKNAELGYTLQNRLVRKIGIKGARIFASGSNLFTISHLKNILDPESSYSSYPLIRIYNLGLNIKI